jgi:hypothetical protein
LNKLHFSVLFFLFSLVGLAQGLSCSEVEPFCAGGSALVFPNTNQDMAGAPSSAEPGIDYSCTTGGGPNNPNAWLYPVWYYLRINADGDLLFTISQSENEDGSGDQLDVDFIAWGPFTNANINCTNDLNNSNKIDCSYLSDTSEVMEINGAQEGEIYVVMVSNYSRLAGFISMEQTNTGNVNAGSTDCSIVNTNNYCEGDVISLDATNSSATSYEWFQDGTLLAETGPVLSNVVAPSAFYTANALDNLGVSFTT